MDTMVFATWQVYVSTFCIGVAGALVGFVVGAKWERKRRRFAVKTVVKEDGSRETHLMTTVTEDEAEILEYMENAADAFEQAKEELDEDERNAD